jgi:hypothetical protein
MRFIFDHRSIFKVTSIDVSSKPGLMILTMKRDEKMPNDDLDNNIATQIISENINPNPITLAIAGSKDVYINSNQSYSIINNVKDYSFTFKLLTIDNNDLSNLVAEIINQNDTSCTIKANAGGTQCILQAKNNEVTLKKVLSISTGF